MDDFVADVVRDRARDRRKPGRGRLPLHPHRRAGLYRLCRCAFAGPDARARRRPERRISPARSEAESAGRCRASATSLRPSTSAAATSAACGTAKAAMTPSPSGCSTSCRIDRFLLEYDSPRAGSFEPLRFVPKGKVVVLGPCQHQSAGAGKDRRSQAPHRRGAKFIPLDQLAISPQCGFASDVVGNRINDRRAEAQARTGRGNGPAGLGIVLCGRQVARSA